VGESARGYAWPPFAAGNTAGQRHGATGARLWRPLAASLTDELASAAPWTTRPAYAAQVAAWARVEAQLSLVSEWLDEVGLLDDEGKPRPATSLADRLEVRAARLREALGLTPQSLGRLLLVVAAVDRAQGGQADALELLLAEGRLALERAAERQAEAP